MNLEHGCTVWFTGLSGAGKSTVSNIIEAELRQRDLRVEVLDGDVIRTHLSKGLGFSKADRDTNIRRIGWVCEVLSRNGVVAIAAAISPYREIRDEVRGKVGRFVEVYMECPVPVLADRDVKGLYKKALAGEIKNFTGVDDPYEAAAQSRSGLPHRRPRNTRSRARPKSSASWKNWVIFPPP